MKVKSKNKTKSKAKGRSIEQELRQKVSTAGKILYHLGLTEYMGHVSARVPGTDRIIIKPRHSETVHGMGEVGPKKLVVIDLDGNLVEGNDDGDGPPSERFIHTEIYRARPDVGGVVHTHQMLATVFGVVERKILPILHVEAPLLINGVPTYPSPDLITDPERGKAVAKVIGKAEVCHLQGHGIATASPTVEQATLAAIHLDRLAQANYIAAQLGGTPKVIAQEEIEQMAASGKFVGYKVRWAYYASLVS
jgi:L-ribulose-5-phosphate 4-epimerase